MISDTDDVVFKRKYIKKLESPIKLHGKKLNELDVYCAQIFPGDIRPEEIDSLLVTVVDHIIPFVPKDNFVSVHGGHYLGNGEYVNSIGGKTGTYDCINPPDFLSKKTFEAAVLTDKLLTNEYIFLSYLVHNIGDWYGLNGEKRPPAMDICAPFPNEYSEIIFEALGKEGLLINSHDFDNYYIHKKGMTERVDLREEMKHNEFVLMFYESNLRNHAERMLKNHMRSGNALEFGDVVRLNPDILGETFDIAQITAGGVCDITPLCKSIQVQRLIDEQDIGVSTAVNFLNRAMYKCVRNFAVEHIAFSKKPMNLINAIFQLDENDNKVKTRIDYFLYPDLYPKDIREKITVR